VDESEEEMSEIEKKALRKKLTAARKRSKSLKENLLVRLDLARSKLDPKECEQLVLEISRQDLKIELDRYVADHRQQIIAAIETWWDKYRVNLQDIEIECESAAKKLALFLEELGYANRTYSF
jgi:type I restriction enzyme M protein